MRGPKKSASLKELALPFEAKAAYAYSPRENTGSRGGTHILLSEDFQQGRIKRERGDTLCKKKFWGLDTQDHGDVNCKRCLELARKLTGATEPQEEAMPDKLEESRLWRMQGTLGREDKGVIDGDDDEG